MCWHLKVGIYNEVFSIVLDDSAAINIKKHNAASLALNTINVHNFKFPLSVYISADTDWFWQRPREEKVQRSFVNVSVWHHHRELVSFCTDRTKAVIRNEWQGAFHLWWEKIFVSKYLSAGTIFLQAFLVLHIFCIIMKGGAERAKLLHSVVAKWQNSRCSAFSDNKCLNAIILRYWQIPLLRRHYVKYLKKNFKKGIKIFKDLYREHFKIYLTKVKQQVQKCVLRI